MNQPYSDNVHDWVKDYYGKVLQSSSDLKTNACCAVAPPSWIRGLLENIHPDVAARFYGCGFPIPEALHGRTVVDLGCGSGRDVYLLAQRVGQTGRVVGVDMTEDQLDVARSTAEWHRERFGYAESNVAFHRGYIEDLSALPLEPESVDVFVSNCVVNLSPRKDLVLAEAHRLLREGGEFYLSDVVVDRRLPEALSRDPLLYSECLGGAWYRHDFEDLARRHGFLDPRVTSVAPITINNRELEARVGSARFFSVTYRLFKLPRLDARCEDYGQLATYRGGIPQHEVLFALDDHHLFEAQRPERVCGNTAAMLEDTRFREHFDVTGDRSTHFGLFDCSATLASQQYAGSESDMLSSSRCC